MKENNTECQITCWGIAAFVGLVAMAMLFMFAEFSALQAIFTGGLIGTALGVMLSLTVCTTQTAAADLAAADKPAMRYAAEAAERRGAPAHAPAAAAAPVPATPAPAPAPAARAEPAAKAAPAEAKTAPAAQAAPADETAAEPVRTANMLSAPRAGGADDLKLIGGVGPKLEQTLNELGVYHFDQVAKFTKEDIAWVDGNLRFKGRIERDDWMGQAKILAAGGETEFSKKKT